MLRSESLCDPLRKTSELGSVPRLEILLCTTQPREDASLAISAFPDESEMLPERLYAPLPGLIAALVAEHKLSRPRIHLVSGGPAPMCIILGQNIPFLAKLYMSLQALPIVSDMLVADIPKTL